ncbi:MAG: HD domain-containing protein [Telmatospirillum sp.]|nr:HD domain-containing protein [Telmatospirillum sp.]
MSMKLDQWISLLRIDASTVATLREFAPMVEPHMDRILDTFYAHLAAGEEAPRLFGSTDMIRHARAAQRHHWMTYVLAGRFDQSYFDAARAIGRSHNRVGVDLMMFTGAYSVVQNELTGLACGLCCDGRGGTLRLIQAINQAVFLDMGLAVSAYYDIFVGALEDMSNELNFSLARAGEFRDNETGLHLIRMSRMCHALALAIGRDAKWAQMILVASPLHDVGKIGIPDSILLKPGTLDEEERETMRRHPVIGGSIIPDHSAEVIGMARRISLTHHERWDGTGYPTGLKGEEIPLEGRIAAICDVYDALLSARPYKAAWEKDRVTAYLRDNAGRHFDPALVSAFLSIQDDIDDIQRLFAEETGGPRPHAPGVDGPRTY